jgi:N-acetylneuraminic acid mutarotase
MKKRLWFFLTMSLAFSLLYSSCSNSSSTDLVGNWTKRSDLDGLARTGASQFTIGKFAYLGTGVDVNSKRFKDFWKYNSDNNSWTQVASLPDSILSTATNKKVYVPARNAAVAFSIGTKGYIGTGTDGDFYLKDFWEYNSVSNVWTQKADFGGTARRGAVAFVLGKDGYVGTGYDGNSQKDFWKYDTTSNTWALITNGFSGSKRQNAASFVINGKAYICTGTDNGGYLDDFWNFDGTNWTKLRPISNTSSESYDDDYNIVRSNAVGFASSTHGYIAMGYNSSVLKTVWEYDYINDLWSQKTSFEGTERMNAVSFSIGDRLFVTTGENGSSYVFDDLWEFKPSEEYDEYN